MGMNDRFDLDAALTELAGDVAKATPRPGADLMARVLADAANVAASKAAMDRASAATRVTNVKRPSLFDMLFGWTATATAAAALAFVVGMGVGMQIDADLPMMANDDGPTVEFFATDSGFLPDEFL